MLNLDFYTGQDFYSDGDIEQELLEFVQSGRDVLEVLIHDTRWPMLYHLSPERRNLLEWYPFRPNASLLEIGAGCGALTELFCQKVESVTAIELSRKRAEIIQARCQHLTNLEIYVGNMYDISFEKTFDYITLIGVLEYTKSFIRTLTPYHDFFRKIQTWIKKDGCLIIAIENKFGLKYFAGAREDHSGKFFDGIEGYSNHQSCETFGKEELRILLSENGFDNIRFYYPYPDYKLPAEIYSDDFLPTENNLLNNAPNYDQERLQLFDERLAFLQIIKNRQFGFFANSFLVFANNSNIS